MTLTDAPGVHVRESAQELPDGDGCPGRPCVAWASAPAGINAAAATVDASNNVKRVMVGLLISVV
jgi:hypothetical protein